MNDHHQLVVVVKTELVRIQKWRRIGFFFLLLHLCMLITASSSSSVAGDVTTRRRQLIRKQNNSSDLDSFPPVQLHMENDNVVIENGIVSVTFTVPGGMVTNIQYNGIDNLLEQHHSYDGRGYWDVVWSKSGDNTNLIDKAEGTNFKVIMENENQIEVSFTKLYDPSSSATDTQLPINIDKRYILLRGYHGFYSYAIFERLEEGWPAIDAYQGRIVFKLQENLFQFMAVGDERQRIMPTMEDRETGQVLDYPEAVRLTHPRNRFLRGEVDDKYQYSSDNKDNRVHGWICGDPPTGFWMITPSDEFKTAGPLKQDLTSHAGPITLSMFFSTHYAGPGLGIKFEEGEGWKKVFGPVAIYLNSHDFEPLTLWTDAKEQMLIEKDCWPYDFPQSPHYPKASQRGWVSGRILVRDSYVNERLITGNSAYVGLAPPGEVGSWQNENKGYQFWTQADEEGYFLIKNVLEGNYSLYAWVPDFIGDYKSDAYVNVVPGKKTALGTLIYEPPRTGPTLWEIGIPDRTAMEFFIPDPSPTLMNQLYMINPQQKFRQYGLWDRYTQLYPLQDLIFNVGSDNYRKDWFFAHVNRHVGNKTYVPTTWQIVFDLDNVDQSSTYTLQIALASIHEAELQVRINDPYKENPHFTTGQIGKDNAIARHGIHGLYWLFSVQINGNQLVSGKNIIFLTQTRNSSPWKGLMYDYIRFEGPPTN